jgi:hypothetical protein
VEQPAYAAWVRLAEQLSLPVEFELGARAAVPFGELLASATACVTTSVLEGFGLAFLEPWLVCRPAAGRKLPEVTDEFEAQGVDLHGLYTRLDIPCEWIDMPSLRRAVEAQLHRRTEAYARPLDPHAWDRFLHAASRGDRIDFGRLDTENQARVIQRVAADRDLRNEVTPDELLPSYWTDVAVAHNPPLVRRNFGLAGYGLRLLETYRAALTGAPPACGDADVRIETLLDSFLSPERLFPVLG